MGRRRGGLLLIVLGIIVGIGVGLYVYIAVAQVPPKIEYAQVVVAKDAVSSRSFIGPAQVETKPFPKDLVPPNALTKVDDAIGKFAQAPIYPGEIIIKDKLSASQPKAAEPGQPASAVQPEVSGTAPFSLDPRLEPGKVVMTFPSDQLLATGAVRPGDHLDILTDISLSALRAAASTGVTATVAPPQAQGAAGEMITALLFQNVVVQEIGSVTSSIVKPGQPAPPPTSGNLILIVSRDDALAYKAIKDASGGVISKLELVLRPVNDTQEYPVNPTTLTQALSKYGIKAP